MALPLRRQTWSFHTIEAKQDVVDSLRLHRSESSLRSTIDPLPSFTLTPAPPTVPCNTSTSNYGRIDTSPPALPAVDSASSSIFQPNLLRGGKDNASLLNLLPRPLTVQYTARSVDQANDSLPVLAACSEKRRIGFTTSSRPVDEEIKDIEDEGVMFTVPAVPDERQKAIEMAVREMEKADSLGEAKDDSARKAEISKEVQIGGRLGERAETLPTTPVEGEKKPEEEVIETEHFKIFPCQEAFEEYARGRITAAHPKVTLELKRSPHTVTISCRNRRKEYTSCQFLLRGREEVGPNGFNGKYKLAKGGEDEVIGHNAACLARLNGRDAASKAASPAVSPPKIAQMAQTPPIMPTPSTKADTQPKLPARATTEAVPTIPIKPQPAKPPALPISIPPPTFVRAGEVRKKRVIVIEPDSDDDLSDLEEESKAGRDRPGVQKGSSKPTNVDKTEESGESTEEEDFETPAQLRKRKAAHPGNVLPSRARRYRPAYYGL